MRYNRKEAPPSAIMIYCPECAKLGKKKKLLQASADARGTLYPFCKEHGNVTVTLPQLKTI